MKKMYVGILITIFLLVVNSTSGYVGMYSPSTNLMYCFDASCLHEIGHRMDTELGNPSLSDEFRMAVYVEMMGMKVSNDDFPTRIAYALSHPQKTTWIVNGSPMQE